MFPRTKRATTNKLTRNSATSFALSTGKISALWRRHGEFATPCNWSQSRICTVAVDLARFELCSLIRLYGRVNEIDGSLTRDRAANRDLADPEIRTRSPIIRDIAIVYCLRRITVFLCEESELMAV